MRVFQDTYIIEDDVASKCETGELSRSGGVIRHNTGKQKGQIAKMYDPVNSIEIKPGALAVKALRLAWNHRDTVWAGTKLSITLAKIKKHKHDICNKLKKSLKIYRNALENDSLTLGIVEEFMKRLDDFKTLPNFEKINIFSFEEINLLLNCSFEYTKLLAANNSIELTIIEKDIHSLSDNPVIKLQSYLRTQKRIFELAS
ncbi:hypothetical protein [Gottfriedia solisilvae]|uniref:Uncharacterized protein n=1 Tax=Gottfriedia solisilvae TaxID=1516104 RepID=A0A8J3EX91_9BACI|nr:hypothetical protein [Gottfriedia solisilvae]GGI12589.1 hypothetical protein GCM10007380_13670 [Gottfriedia solisilvae]